MAYTTSWTDDRPAGSVAAGNIDNEIRLLRQQLHERMNNVVVDWAADPVVPITGSGSSGGSGQRIIPFTSFIAYGPILPIYSDVNVATATQPLIASLSNVIPYGSVITQLEWLIDPQAGNLTCALHSRGFDVSLVVPDVVVNTIIGSGAGIQKLTTAPFSFDTTNQGSYLKVSQSNSSSFFIYAVKVTYT